MIESELPFRIEDLLHERTIEGNRIEFKATWNDVIGDAVTSTVCAFANDLLNLNGGYIVLGVEEREGHAVLPPRGLDGLDLDRVQKRIYERCRRIEPEYQPLVCHEHYQDRALLVLWCPGGDNRPYRAPDGRERAFYVRQGALTIRAQGDTLRQLIELTAKVPFDDRRNQGARIEDLSPTLVRRFLHEVGSRLLDQVSDDRDLYRRLKIVAAINAHEVPRNVGLLFFHEDPERFFPGARIDVVRFGDDAGGDLLEERIFRGPLHEQVQAALSYLRSLTSEFVIKEPAEIKAGRVFPYPEAAVREVLVNAVYHRGYDAPQEPIKVYLYSDRLEITSYPGPMPGVRPEHFLPGAEYPAVPARNRRIGELLKELHLAEKRGTGVPRILRALEEAHAPPPSFDFDQDRTWFRVRLYVPAVYGLAEGMKMWNDGRRRQAVAHLRRVFLRQPDMALLNSLSLAGTLIRMAWESGAEDVANEALAHYEARIPAERRLAGPFLAAARGLVRSGRKADALALLRQVPEPPVGEEPGEVAEMGTLLAEAGDPYRAYLLWERAFGESPYYPEFPYQLAISEIWMAHNWYRGNQKQQLLADAAVLLRRVVDMDDAALRSGFPDLKSSAAEVLADVRRELGLTA